MTVKIPDNAYILPIQLRFADTDMAGHVNHATYVTYLETARVEWIKEQGDNTEFKKIPIIIARVEIDYHKPIFLYQNPIVAVWVSKIGNKSYTHDYAVYVEDDQGNPQICSTARTIQVFYDYKENKSIKIPDTEREILKKYYSEETQ